jgi:hypothetical protein
MKRRTKNSLAPALQSVPPEAAPKAELSSVTVEHVARACQIGSQIAANLTKRALIDQAQAVLGIVQVLAIVSDDRSLLIKEAAEAKVNKPVIPLVPEKQQ